MSNAPQTGWTETRRSMPRCSRSGSLLAMHCKPDGAADLLGYHSKNCMLQVSRTAPGAHTFTVTAVLWYPVDTGLFVTASFDLKVQVRGPGHHFLSAVQTCHWQVEVQRWVQASGAEMCCTQSTNAAQASCRCGTATTCCRLHRSSWATACTVRLCRRWHMRTRS